MAVSEEFLSKYADLIVQVGLNIRAGQRLRISGPLESAPLIRLVTARAYDRGARLVFTHITDEQLQLIRFQHAPRDSFNEVPEFMAAAQEQHIKNGGALLNIYAEDPDLLKDQDPALIAISTKAYQQIGRPVMELIVRNATNWCVISLPVRSWVAKVFPDLPVEEGTDQLWQAIFRICRVDRPDPVAEWQQHLANLSARCDYMNRKAYDALHYTSPGTDFTVGLPAGHCWIGGGIASETGIRFVPNLPTEEIFTLPHKNRVDGVVRASRPLAYAGKLIEDFSLTFKEGRVVDFQAGANYDTLRELLNTDEGARRLGEVALVPNSSPVSQSGILFYNSLFDENAASHLALGRAYAFTIENGEQMDEETFAAAGGNISLTHEDFMIGSSETNIDGIRNDGTREPVMRQGEWAFKV